MMYDYVCNHCDVARVPQDARWCRSPAPLGFQAPFASKRTIRSGESAWKNTVFNGFQRHFQWFSVDFKQFFNGF